jgi:hypothetical protein
MTDRQARAWAHTQLTERKTVPEVPLARLFFPSGEQAVEQVCRRTKRRSSTLETLSVSSGRPSGKRSWMTFFYGQREHILLGLRIAVNLVDEEAGLLAVVLPTLLGP